MSRAFCGHCGKDAQPNGDLACDCSKHAKRAAAASNFSAFARIYGAFGGKLSPEVAADIATGRAPIAIGEA